MNNEYHLTDDQITGILKLIDAEIELNAANGDDAYNSFWEQVKQALGYSA
jgi:hypothetical protein